MFTLICVWNNSWYFSLQCGPCQYFTPELIGAYNNLKKVGKDFEVVFASWDNEEKEFDGYRKDMPWLTLPFNDGRVFELGEHFDVDGKYTLRWRHNECDSVSNHQPNDC